MLTFIAAVFILRRKLSNVLQETLKKKTALFTNFKYKKAETALCFSTYFQTLKGLFKYDVEVSLSVGVHFRDITILFTPTKNNFWSDPPNMPIPFPKT